MSKKLHSRFIPVLIHPLILRRRGAGQVDIVYKRRLGQVVIVEAKASGILGEHQLKRLRRSQEWLAQILNCRTSLSVRCELKSPFAKLISATYHKIMKWKVLLLVTVLAAMGATPSAQARMNSKLKVMLTTAAYGTVGGALLGTASLAFGTESRAIFQGASIGLWGGLIFGGYILYSHHQKSRYSDDGQYPEDGNSPYTDPVEEGQYDQRSSHFNLIQDYAELKNADWDNRTSLGGKALLNELPIGISFVAYSF